MSIQSITFFISPFITNHHPSLNLSSPSMSFSLELISVSRQIYVYTIEVLKWNNFVWMVCWIIRLRALLYEYILLYLLKFYCTNASELRALNRRMSIGQFIAIHNRTNRNLWLNRRSVCRRYRCNSNSEYMYTDIVSKVSSRLHYYFSYHIDALYHWRCWYCDHGLVLNLLKV